MAEEGALAVGEHGGHPLPAERDVRVADGVDAPVHAVEAAGGYAHPNRAPRKAEVAQLSQ
jgi:hypothetical protein